MPACPAASTVTPRACPTANALRAFWPKKRSSTATASGSCSSIRWHTCRWMLDEALLERLVRLGVQDAAVQRRERAAAREHHAVAGVRGAGIDAEDDHHQGDSADVGGRLRLEVLSVFVDLPDDGHAISYKALQRGTPVRAADGTEVGKVRRVLDNARENIFDGIVVESRDGMRFVDAPEVKRVAELAVTLTISAEEFLELPPPQSTLKQRWDHNTLVRRSRRAGRDWKRRWGNR